MAAVGVPGRIGVVLEEVDLPGDALLAQAGLGGVDEGLEDSLPRLVVGDELANVVALGGGVLGVGAHVEVEAGAVLEEHVRGAAPRHDPAEQVASHLVRGQPALAAEGTGHPVLVLQAEDSAVHASSIDPGGR